MLCQRFAESFLHRSDHRVLGYRLQPFSLWHQFCLQAVDLPMFSVEAPSFDQLHLAVRICSVRYPLMPARVGKLRHLLVCGGRSLSVESSRLHSYIQDFYQPPEFWREARSGSGGGLAVGPAPQILVTLVSLMALGLERSAAWNTGAGEAEWLSAGYLSAHNPGALNFKTAEDYEGMKLIDELREAKAQQEKNHGRS